MDNIRDLDDRTQEVFNSILLKDNNDLTNEDIAFLRARSSYLSKSQTQDYAEYLGDNYTPAEEVEVTAVTPTWQELKNRAKFHGIATFHKSREQVEQDLNTVEGPAGAPQPE